MTTTSIAAPPPVETLTPKRKPRRRSGPGSIFKYLLAVLFLADVALGLLTRAAPALNAFSLGPPFKILLTLMTASVVFVVLPHLVDGRVERMVSTLVQVLR